MLVVETIGKIRRAFFVQGKPIKAICRELRVSRKVVRKVLRSGATEFQYDAACSRCRRSAPGEELDSCYRRTKGSPRGNG